MKKKLNKNQISKSSGGTLIDGINVEMQTQPAEGQDYSFFEIKTDGPVHVVNNSDAPHLHDIYVGKQHIHTGKIFGTEKNGNNGLTIVGSYMEDPVK